MKINLFKWLAFHYKCQLTFFPLFSFNPWKEFTNFQSCRELNISLEDHFKSWNSLFFAHYMPPTRVETNKSYLFRVFLRPFVQDFRHPYLGWPLRVANDNDNGIALLIVFRQNFLLTLKTTVTMTIEMKKSSKTSCLSGDLRLKAFWMHYFKIQQSHGLAHFSGKWYVTA